MQPSPYDKQPVMGYPAMGQPVGYGADPNAQYVAAPQTAPAAGFVPGGQPQGYAMAGVPVQGQAVQNVPMQTITVMQPARADGGCCNSCCTVDQLRTSVVVLVVVGVFLTLIMIPFVALFASALKKTEDMGQCGATFYSMGYSGSQEKVFLKNARNVCIGGFVCLLVTSIWGVLFMLLGRKDQGKGVKHWTTVSLATFAFLVIIPLLVMAIVLPAEWDTLEASNHDRSGDCIDKPQIENTKIAGTFFLWMATFWSVIAGSVSIALFCRPKPDSIDQPTVTQIIAQPPAVNNNFTQ